MKRTKLSAIPIDVAKALFMEMTYWEILRLAMVAQVWFDAFTILKDSILVEKASCFNFIKFGSTETMVLKSIGRKMKQEQLDHSALLKLLYAKEYYMTVVIIINSDWCDDQCDNMCKNILKDNRQLDDYFRAFIQQAFEGLKRNYMFIKSIVKWIDTRRENVTDRMLYLLDYILDGTRISISILSGLNKLTTLKILERATGNFNEIKPSTLPAAFNILYPLFEHYNWKFVLMNRHSRIARGPDRYTIITSRQSGLDIVNMLLPLLTLDEMLDSAFYPVETFESVIDSKGGISSIRFNTISPYWIVTPEMLDQRREYLKAMMKRDLVFGHEFKRELFQWVGPVEFPWIQEIGMITLKVHLKYHTKGTYANEYAIISELKRRGEHIDLSVFDPPSKKDDEEGIDPCMADTVSRLDCDTVRLDYLQRVFKQFPYIAETWIGSNRPDIIPLLFEYFHRIRHTEEYLEIYENRFKSLKDNSRFMLACYTEILKRGICPLNPTKYYIMKSEKPQFLF